MSQFGWSLPAGCGSLPGEEMGAIDLSDGRTIEGYGKSQHGLRGTDADLENGGQIEIDEAWWTEDGKITVSGRCNASLVPEEKWAMFPEADSLSTEQEAEYQAYMEHCQSVIFDLGYSGEWDGDYWVISNPFSVETLLEWDDDKTDEENKEVAKLTAYELVTKDQRVLTFQESVTAASNDMTIEAWRKGCSESQS